MHILLISTYFPVDFRTSVHGVYKRMETFIEAIKEIASLDMLFYVPTSKRHSSMNSELEDSLSRHWNADIKLFLCPMPEYNVRSESDKWLYFGKGIYSFFNQKERREVSSEEQVRALERCLERKPDVIFAHRLSAMCPLLLTKKSLPPIFFDMDDIEHVVLTRYIKNRNNLKSKFLYLLLPAMTGGEYKAIKLASKTSVCSELDRNYLTERFKLPGVITIPNSVSIPALEPITSEPSLLFLGADYKPNLQAAEFLVKKIWPHVLEEMPDARLIIAGTPPDKFNFNADIIPGLECPGFVDDLDGLYKRARATAVPILVGGGTRFKIIEAAAYGRPTVATTVGAEGIEFSNESEILIRDDPKQFAEACVKLLCDSNTCEKIGLSAREKAIELYDRDNVITTIRQEIMSLPKADQSQIFFKRNI